MIKRPYGPGAKGASAKPGKKSEYGRQLSEKQKAREIYGLKEHQFKNYVSRAERMAGNTAENLAAMLERRLDSVVSRLNLAVSRAQARQMVSHGFIKVNGKKVNIPSYLIASGDLIEPKDKEKYSNYKPNAVPNWLEVDVKKVSAKVKHIPTREEIDTPINENLIIEYYSR